MSYSTLAMVLLLLSPNLAKSTSFFPVPFPNRVDDAPNVVRATVVHSQADWSVSRDSKKRIYTFTEMQVEETFKGSISDRTITVKEVGGEKDGIGLEIPGTAKFSPGEDIVLFLGTRDKDQAYEVRGMMTGKYPIKRDENGKEYIETSSGDEHGHETTEHEGVGESGIKKFSLEQIRELAKNSPEHPQPMKMSSSGSAKKTEPLKQEKILQKPTPETNAKTELTPQEPPLKEESTFSYWMCGIIFIVLLFWLLKRGKK